MKTIEEIAEKLIIDVWPKWDNDHECAKSLAIDCITEGLKIAQRMCKNDYGIYDEMKGCLQHVLSTGEVPEK